MSQTEMKKGRNSMRKERKKHEPNQMHPKLTENANGPRVVTV